MAQDNKQDGMNAQPTRDHHSSMMQITQGGGADAFDID